MQIYSLNKIDNNSKANEKIDNVSISREISELEKRLRDLPKKGSEWHVYFAKRVCKIINLFSTIT